MDDLIIRVLNGDASPFEVERLSRWRDESPENDAYFREISLVWELTAPEPRAKGSQPPRVQEVLRAAGEGETEPGKGDPLAGSPAEGNREAPTSQGETPAPGGKTRPPWQVWGLLAASVAALSMGVQLVGRGGPAPLADFQAPEGETRTVTLGDGSFVRLGEGSRLQVWDGLGTREVSLEGRAFFAVTRDEARPFVIRTGPGEVRVLGTRFEVAGEGEGIRTVVVEGRVAMSNRAGSVEVPAGSVARMREGEPPTAEAVEDPWDLLSWPEGVLVFQGTPLSQVAEDVSRYFQRSLVVSDSTLRSRRVTAWFQGESFEEVADALCAVTGASCTNIDVGVSMASGDTVGGVR